MANVFYNEAKKEIFDQTFDIRDDADIKMMLISNAVAYAPDDAHLVVDAGGANDPADAESNVDGYARGWQGAGRKVPANRAIATDQFNNRAEFTFDNIAFGALGNGANETIVASILIKEGVANDTTSRLIGYFDFADFTTNGASFTLQVDAEGAIHLTSLAGALELLPRMLKKLWSWVSEKLTYQQVAGAKKLGVKPHIYRTIRPLKLAAQVPPRG